MGDLRVSSGSLGELAATCRQGAESSTPDDAPLSHSTFRATAAAVLAVNAEISVAGLRVADRLTSIGERVTRADAAYAECDAGAGARIDDCLP